MAFSMHSHSGQFCPGHAKDELETILLTAISTGYKTLALTEHMPRTAAADLYPDETSIDPLLPRHELYLQEAVRLREKYAGQLEIIIGFEGEWIRTDYEVLIKELASDDRVDFWIGSVHHVHGIPIDYDAAFYAKAIATSGGSEEQLYEAYFDLQYSLLQTMRPRVVGHFDLIKLLSSKPDRDLREWKGVWEKIERNLKCVVEYGGLLEINSSALRKGLNEPYPGKVICIEYLAMGGRFTMSDDSHGIAQIATNYARAINFLEGLGVHQVWVLKPGEMHMDGENKNLGVRAVPITEIKVSMRL